jgi:hypothetical protein
VTKFGNKIDQRRDIDVRFVLMTGKAGQPC